MVRLGPCRTGSRALLLRFLVFSFLAHPISCFSLCFSSLRIISPSAFPVLCPPTPQHAELQSLQRISRARGAAALGAGSASKILEGFSFQDSDETLGDPVELHRAWFKAWGFAEPGPKVKKGGSKGKKKGAGGGAKAGGFGAQSSKLLCQVPPKDLVSVLRADCSASQNDEPSEEALKCWGAAARTTIEEELPAKGAVLLRGLPIKSAEQFSTFWRGYLEAPGLPKLEDCKYSSLGPSSGRLKLSGIDMATNVPPSFLLLNHNEM
mmetsp:Transcript_46386/g.72624  ORF Transcript_46386/g.72624 Transcript_46386/m.72624 type:complete len:265 (-) Transcript_46386:434-1228(-)